MAGTEFRRSFTKALENHNANMTDKGFAETSGRNSIGAEFKRNFAKALEDHRNPHPIMAGSDLKRDIAITFEERRKRQTLPDIPGWWKPMPPNTLCELVELDKKSKEFEQVAANFDKQILSVHRVQNPVLYQHYQYLKRQMQERNPNIEVEMLLYHGTSSDVIDNINNHGFNRSYCGKNGTVYGDGVYFATSPNYSSMSVFAERDYRGIQYLYQARVLIGRTCRGRVGLKEPPLLGDSSGRRYDSVSGSDSSVFAVFYDVQAYPEYLISLSSPEEDSP